MLLSFFHLLLHIRMICHSLFVELADTTTNTSMPSLALLHTKFSAPLYLDDTAVDSEWHPHFNYCPSSLPISQALAHTQTHLPMLLETPNRARCLCSSLEHQQCETSHVIPLWSHKVFKAEMKPKGPKERFTGYVAILALLNSFLGQCQNHILML